MLLGVPLELVNRRLLLLQLAPVFLVLDSESVGQLSQLLVLIGDRKPIPVVPHD